MQSLNDVKSVFRGKGCNYCKNTGYKGRIAIHEVLVSNRSVRRMIVDGASVDAITDYARKELGMTTLKESALELVRQGVTTIDELLKVAYSVD